MTKGIAKRLRAKKRRKTQQKRKAAYPDIRTAEIAGDSAPPPKAPRP